MRAVVFAYSDVGDRCLRVLHARGVEVALVVTHRDRPGEVLWFARVADTAEELGLSVLHVEDVGVDGLHAAVEHARPDVIFSFYFRSMLPMRILELAPCGAFNMHGSMLPRYRGRAPTNWAVLHGESETGATLHEMVAKADAGRIVDQQAVPILPDDTAAQVFTKVTVAAEIVLWRSLASITQKHIAYRQNDLSHGSYFGSRTPEDGRIDWARPAAEIYNLVRAVAPPYPGAFTDIATSRLVVAEARLAPRRHSADDQARHGLQVEGDAIVGVCGDGGRLLIHRLLDNDRPVDPRSLRALLAAATDPTRAP